MVKYRWNIDDHHRNPNMNNRDHLVGRPTNLCLAKNNLIFSLKKTPSHETVELWCDADLYVFVFVLDRLKFQILWVFDLTLAFTWGDRVQYCCDLNSSSLIKPDHQNRFIYVPSTRSISFELCLWRRFSCEKVGENFNSNHLSLLLRRVRTVLGRHLGTSTCYSNWILHQSSLKGSWLLPNYYCIIVFTFCLKLFFLAGKSWLSCEFPSSLLDASSRTNVTFSEFRPFDCKKYMIVPTILNKCIKNERGEPKGKNTCLILKMPK